MGSWLKLLNQIFSDTMDVYNTDPERGKNWVLGITEAENIQLLLKAVCRSGSL